MPISCATGHKSLLINCSLAGTLPDKKSNSKDNPEEDQKFALLLGTNDQQNVGQSIPDK